MKKYKFYDTCSLLLKAGHIFDEPETEIIISSITLEELENIKTSSHKDNDIKFAARKVTYELDKEFGNYEIIVFVPSLLDDLQEYEATNDLKIISCARIADEEHLITFVTNDLSCRNLARTILKCPIEPYDEEFDEYTGYKEVTVNEAQLLEFYQNTSINKYGLNVGEYLILRDSDGNLLDVRCWNGVEHRYINSKPIESTWFGKISPYNGDIYQKLAIDSLYFNQLTVLRGPAGVGKSLIGLSYLFSLLERHKIDRIYVLCNPVATKDAAKLGLVVRLK